MDNSKTILGLKFTAIRTMRPIPHWRVQIPSGEILDNGVAGFNGESRPKLWESIEYLAKRMPDRFIREFTV